MSLKVRHATAPGRYGDGNGLYLNVRPNGSRAWLIRYKLPGGKTRDMGLGSLAEVTLAEARDLASKARETLVARTFREVAEDYVKAQEAGWKNPVHRAQWRSTLKTYAYPDSWRNARGHDHHRGRACDPQANLDNEDGDG